MHRVAMAQGRSMQVPEDFFERPSFFPPMIYDVDESALFWHRVAVAQGRTAQVPDYFFERERKLFPPMISDVNERALFWHRVAMAQGRTAQVPDYFFERERVSLGDFQRVVPEGGYLKDRVMLLIFSEMCQSTNRTHARWKEVSLQSSESWGSEASEGLTNMIQSGLLKNLKYLRLQNWNDLGSHGIVALAESLKSGKVGSLRTLELSSVTFLEGLQKVEKEGSSTSMKMATDSNKDMAMVGAEALGSWLESDHAQKLEKLQISGQFWSEPALVVLLKSFRSGAVHNLVHLDLKWLGFRDSSGAEIRNGEPEKAIVAELAESLRMGQINTLRTLQFGTFDIFGIHAFFTLSQCSELRGLETLILYGSDGIPGIEAMGSELQNLKTLKVYSKFTDDEGDFLFSSGYFSSLRELRLQLPEETGRTAEAMAKWLESGNASHLAEIHLWGTQDTFQNMDLVIDACFSGKSERLEVIVIPKSLFEEDKISKWFRALGRGRLPLLREFTCLRVLSLSDVVLGTIKGAYNGNKWLTAAICKTSDYAGAKENLRYKKRYSPKYRVVFRYDRFECLNALPLRNQRRKETLKDLEKEPREPGTYGKVFLCGSPGVGKTTLRLTLQKTWTRRLFPSKKPDSTRGIEVDHVRLARKKSSTQEVELAFWDLAGQPDYEVLHSTFLPDLALGDGQATFFIVVCSANASGNVDVKIAEGVLRYWLRFISSNSAKGVNKDLRRKVLVVLNCFQGQQSGHDPKRWQDILESCEETFKDFLEIHLQPFICDARKKGQARPLKKYLHEQAQKVLRETQVPRVCADILQRCKEWVKEEGNREYPILPWEQYYSTVVRVEWSLKTVIAATVYLHETGHIVLFRRPKEGGESSTTDDQGILVLDPEWLCKQVVGHLLLPDFLLRDGEKSLSSYMQPDGSLPLALVKKKLFQIPRDKCEEMVSILVRLGLGYKIFADDDKVFIPALIQDDSIPTWFTGIDQTSCSWVMGFSLMSKDSRTTFLPVAVLRKLQVTLAEDVEIGRRPDSSFKAAVTRIWFKWEGLGFLVEHYGDPMDCEHNRLDILVKPLVEGDDESHEQVRKKQVAFAQIIVDKALDSASGCPGLELKRSVVCPWVMSDVGFVPLKGRDVSFSVELMKDNLRKAIENKTARGQGGASWATTWSVGKQRVKYQDLLGEDDWRDVVRVFETRFELTEKALELLDLPKPSLSFHHEEGRAAANVHSENEDNHDGLANREEATSSTHVMQRHLSRKLSARQREIQEENEDNHDGLANREEATSSTHVMLTHLSRKLSAGQREIQEENEDNHDGLANREEATSSSHVMLRHLSRKLSAGQREIRQGFKEMHQRFDHVDDGVQGITERLQKVLKLQDMVNNHVQFLETFTISEMCNSVPRFPFLTTEEGSGVRAWKRIKDVFRNEAFLHFLCEAGCDKGNMHEVDGQVGVRVTQLKDWAKKFAPILSWSLKIAFFSAKVAGNAVLPGLGLMLPDIPSHMLQNVSTITNGVGDFLNFCSSSIGQSPGKWNMDGCGDEAGRGKARAHLKKLLDELSPEDFMLMVGLRRVTILENSKAGGAVLWICDQCITRYGSRVRKLDPS